MVKILTEALERTQVPSAREVRQPADAHNAVDHLGDEGRLRDVLLRGQELAGNAGRPNKIVR